MKVEPEPVIIKEVIPVTEEDLEEETRLRNERKVKHSIFRLRLSTMVDKVNEIQNVEERIREREEKKRQEKKRLEEERQKRELELKLQLSKRKR